MSRVNECNGDFSPTETREGVFCVGYTPWMEPGEKFIKRLLKFGLMILAFVVSIASGEYYRGLGWLGGLIFVVGAGMGALAIHLFKSLKD